MRALGVDLCFFHLLLMSFSTALQAAPVGIREIHKDPKLAVTELQLFAHIGRGGESNAPARLHHGNLVNPGTLAEAIYDVLVYHAALRLAPFVEMVTQSAVVNHGGGLRKERERVYANPCHYAQTAFAALAGATPVKSEVECTMEKAPMVLPELKSAVSEAGFSAIDGLAALTSEGDLLLSIVHRGSSGPIELTILLDGFKSTGTGEARTLSASQPWAANSLSAPKAVAPVDSKVSLAQNSLRLDLAPYTVMRVRLPRQR